MNWSLFILVMIVGEVLVFLQAVASSRDGYFSERQMFQQGTRGYSFLQHGGMWADFLIITPLIAYLVGKYNFSYLSTWSLGIIYVSFVLWLSLAIFLYAPMGKNSPEAHTHDGKTTVAGGIHIVYATLASWIIAMVYIPNMSEPHLLGRDIIITSGALIPWIFVGVMKFTPQWRFNSSSIAQVYIGILGIIFLMIFRV